MKGLGHQGVPRWGTFANIKKKSSSCELVTTSERALIFYMRHPYIRA